MLKKWRNYLNSTLITKGDEMAIFLLCLSGLCFFAGFYTISIAETGIALICACILLIGAATVSVSDSSRKILVEIRELLKK